VNKSLIQLWIERREYFIKRLMKEHSEGRTDVDILDLLNLINSSQNYYTLSSCSGRIQIIEGRNYSKRKELRSIAKFHYGITKDDLINSFQNIKGDYAWISLQPPIIHIAAKSLDDAIKLLKIARASGFKHSGIQSKNPDRYVIELNSSFRLDIPLRYKGVNLIKQEDIELLVELLNENLKSAKECIIKFKENLSKILNGNKN